MVIIPIRSFGNAKQRLSPVLDQPGRAALSRRLAQHVIDTVLGAGADPLIVTSDEEVTKWATSADIEVMADPGGGLNAAAAAGVARAVDGGRRWAILHGDLAWLEKEDVPALIDALTEGYEPIAPSSDGGTSALGSAHRVGLSYGPGSFHRHLARLSKPKIIARRGLLLDIDTPLDLDASGWLERHG